MSNESKNNSVRHEKALGINKDGGDKNKETTIKTKTNINTRNETKTETKTETNQETKKQETNFKEPVDRKQEAKQEEVNDKKRNDFGTKMAKTRKIVWGIFIIGGTLLIGVLSSLLGGKMRDGYIKPPAYPPDWLFSVVWPILYVAIGISAFIAYLKPDDFKKRRSDLIWYGIQLFLLFFWPLLYFRFDLLIISCIWLALVVISSIICTYRYYRANLISGIIFTIYTLWLLYAMYLHNQQVQYHC